MSKSRQLSAFSFQLLLAVTSAILLIFSFPDYNIEFLAWFAIIPLLFAIDGKKPLKAFLIAYLTGVLFFLGTVYWLIHVTLPGMIVVALYLGLYFGLFGLMASFFNYELPFGSARGKLSFLRLCSGRALIILLFFQFIMLI